MKQNAQEGFTVYILYFRADQEPRTQGITAFIVYESNSAERVHSVQTICTSKLGPQSTQSAGPVRFLIFCLTSIFLLASLVAGRRPHIMLELISRECTPAYLSTGISNLLQPAQTEVVLGQLSTYLASWAGDQWSRRRCFRVHSVLTVLTC
jgi:hypothetical protein